MIRLVTFHRLYVCIGRFQISFVVFFVTKNLLLFSCTRLILRCFKRHLTHATPLQFKAATTNTWNGREKNRFFWEMTKRNDELNEHFDRTLKRDRELWECECVCAIDGCCWSTLCFVAYAVVYNINILFCIFVDCRAPTHYESKHTFSAAAAARGVRRWPPTATTPHIQPLSIW